MYSQHASRPGVSRQLCTRAGAGLLLCVVAALNGCTVGPDFARPEAKLNENWSEQDDPRVMAAGRSGQGMVESVQ